MKQTKLVANDFRLSLKLNGMIVNLFLEPWPFNQFWFWSSNFNKWFVKMQKSNFLILPRCEKQMKRVFVYKQAPACQAKPWSLHSKRFRVFNFKNFNVYFFKLQIPIENLDLRPSFLPRCPHITMWYHHPPHLMGVQYPSSKTRKKNRTLSTQFLGEASINQILLVKKDLMLIRNWGRRQ